MEKSIKIAIDLMGGEKSPDKNLEGVNIFLERNKKATDCFFYFFGKESQVKEKISKYKSDGKDCSDLITEVNKISEQINENERKTRNK